MRAILEVILSRVVEQQKFAEAKNAAIGTISAAAGAALLTTYAIRSGQPVTGYAAPNLLAAACFFVALVLAFYSFLPRVDNRVEAVGSDATKANLYFYEDLKNLSEDAFLTELAMDCKHVGPPTRLERDLANQIIVHSQICSFKYRTFRNVCICAFAGLSVVLAILTLEAIQSKAQTVPRSAPSASK